MPEINCKKNHLFAILSICVMLFQPMLASAKCGGVDYSCGADALSNAHDFTVTMMLYVVYLVYAIAAIVAIIGALQIYIKMNTGEGDVCDVCHCLNLLWCEHGYSQCIHRKVWL